MTVYIMKQIQCINLYLNRNHSTIIYKVYFENYENSYMSNIAW